MFAALSRTAYWPVIRISLGVVAFAFYSTLRCRLVAPYSHSVRGRCVRKPQVAQAVLLRLYDQ